MKSIPVGYENDLLTMVEILRITYYLYEFKKNRRGTAPIYCKLTTDGAERQQFSTGLYVTPDLWDKDAQCVRGTSEDAVLINRRLQDITIELKGTLDSTVRFVESLNLAAHMVMIGDSVTVVTHPASTTHKQLSDADLAAAGVTPTMLRISVGLENTDDLIDDFEQAFAHIG